MGQAKTRGTYEQRKAAAVARREEVERTAPPTLSRKQLQGLYLAAITVAVVPPRMTSITDYWIRT